MDKMALSERLHGLRTLMKQRGLDYYYIPARDQHNNEYVPDCWQRRSWISGFTGSAGDVLVGFDNAMLWTDSRYFLQAEQELDADYFKLMRHRQGDMPSIAEWLCEHAPGKTVGVDPSVIAAMMADQWQEDFSTKDINLIPVDENLIDLLWQDKPELIFNDVLCHSVKYAGVSARDKIALIQSGLREHHIDAHVLTTLDSICWLCNIRGNDVACNPLVVSSCIILSDSVMLFVGCDTITEDQKSYFSEEGIALKSYFEFDDVLRQLTGKVLLDRLTASWWVEQQLDQATIVFADSPVSMMKSIKNQVEQVGAEEAHIRDAVSMIRFSMWLESHWQGQTECSVAQQLDMMRQQDPHCHGLSFSTISGYESNGAVVHYFAKEDTCKVITGDSLLLVDSGGQYDFGTTDITRVFNFSPVTQRQRLHYTLVLQGHLALRHTVFPLGKKTSDLELIARLPLWQHALDFGHGVSHGVGSFLCVHEGITTALSPGMIISNEPGLYLEGQYGIRIENLVLVYEVKDQIDSETGNGPFYGFKDLTLVPYNKDLIDVSLLSDQECRWIDEYHEEVYQRIGPLLTDDEQIWLREKTLALVTSSE